ncbi:MAG: ferrous iron transport protein B [Flavobacteriales bacterium]|nr:ferrous iron transport protein B [Flavobacteriales bacterium]
MKKIALLGNPNCGKTSLFNALTGLNQKVGNFAGVTVDRKSSTITLPDGEKAQLTDLPGAHSLTPNSLDERVVFDVLTNPNDPNYPDLIIAVLDASVLSKGLFIASQVIDLGIPVLTVLNLNDVAARKGISLDEEALSIELGTPVVSINAREKKGIGKLLEALSREISSSEKQFFPKSSYREWLIHSIGDDSKVSVEERMEDITRRYDLIEGIVRKVIDHQMIVQGDKGSMTRKIDRVVLHKLWGPLIFVGIFFLLFQAVFSVAAYPMDWIDGAMAGLGDLISSALPQGLFSSFIVDGLIAGLNGVIIFLPQIMILFGLIAILEDSGYMARASFLNDKLLGFSGMNGKSIVPLVGGFACAVPAIMAARSIGDPKTRLITIMVTPLMSCSARLPVYIFLIAFIVPDTYYLGFIGLQGLFMLGLYMLGIIAAVVMAWVMKKALKGPSGDNFILELPEYQSPRWKDTLMTMINKGKTFVTEAGKVIVLISIVLWFLASFAPGNAFENIEASYTEAPAGWSEEDVEMAIASEKLEASYAGIIGKQIEPLIQPIGFDWKIGIALVTSFAAREVFVGTMSTIYGLHGDSDGVLELRDQLMTQVDPKTGRPVMTMPVALSLVIFYVFAMQCMSTVAVVKKETGGWKWPIIQFTLMTGLAYVASLITFQLFS